jgi:hypothetical protein
VARSAAYTTNWVPDEDGNPVWQSEPVTVSDLMIASGDDVRHQLVIGVDLEEVTKRWESERREPPVRIPGENGRSEWVHLDEPEPVVAPVPSQFVGETKPPEPVVERPAPERKKSLLRRSKPVADPVDPAVEAECRLIADQVRAAGSPVPFGRVWERILRKPAPAHGQYLLDQTVLREWIVVQENMVSPGPKAPEPLPEETGGWGPNEVTSAGVVFGPVSA